MNEIHHAWGMEIKGTINLGLVLIRIGSVLSIAYIVAADEVGLNIFDDKTLIPSPRCLSVGRRS